MAWLTVLNIGYFPQLLLTAMCIFLVYKFANFTFGKARRKPLLKPGTVGRSLGSFETLFDVFSDERGGTGNICVALSLTSKQSLSHQHVRDSLMLLAKRQPVLRATRITSENGDRYFEINEISEVVTKLDITCSDVKSLDWKDVWFEYTAKQFGSNLLWRVVILQEEFIPDTQDYVNTLMFCFKHSIIDGVSSVKLCKQFLHNMNELANDARVDKEVLSLNFLPYFHDVISRKRTWQLVLNFVLTFCVLRSILRSFMKRMAHFYFKTVKYNPYYTQHPPPLDVSSFVGPCRLNMKAFTENETKNILRACKANRCTVTGALAAAANLAFCELMQDGTNRIEDTKIRWEFTINAQRFYDPKPHEEYLGFFVYASGELFAKYLSSGTDDVDFWKVAQKTTKEIHDVVNSEGFVTAETVLYSVLKPNDAVCAIDRKSAICLSPCNSVASYGAFDFGAESQQNPYKLQGCSVQVANHGFPLTFSHANHTINGKMSWQITHDASRVEKDHAQKFAGLCFGKFAEIARGNV